jgi:hypothetical protein
VLQAQSGDTTNSIRQAAEFIVSGGQKLAGTPLARVQNIENNPMQSSDGFECAALFTAA